MKSLPLRLPRHSVLAGVLGALVALGLLFHLRQRENDGLAWFRATNAQLHYKAYQREQLRLANSSRATPGRPVEVETQAGSEYTDQGQATPRAAIQTFAWACEQGKVETVAGLLHFEADQRARAEVLRASLPVEFRARWTNVDTLAAELLILSRLAHPLPQADILSAVPIESAGPEHATVLTPSPVRLRKVNGLWKYDVKASALEELCRQTLDTLGRQAAP